MGQAQRQAARYEDLFDLPDHLIGEIVDGDLHVSPRPASGHVVAAGGIQGELHSPFNRGRGGPGGWWILPEPELHLGGDVLVPDLAGFRRERLPRIEPAPFFTLAPDWVCEIVSPSTERLDRAKKLPLYAREGVSHAWIVNPTTRTLEAYRLEGGGWRLLATHADAAIARVEPFDAIEFDLRVLWGEG